MNSLISGGGRKRFLGRLTPGDHIATVRKGEIYEHHGIFEGNDRIAHFQGPSKGQGQHECKNCGYRPSQTGGVVHTCFKCFCLRESCFVIRYKMHDHQKDEDMDLSYIDSFVAGRAIQGYKCNQIYLELFVDGVLQGHKKIPKGERSKYEFDDQVKLSQFSSFRSAEEVLNAARSCSSRFRKYNLFLNNCEDFAVFCKTGKAVSIQAKKKFSILYKPAKILDHCFLQRRMNKELRRRLARSSSDGSRADGSRSDGGDDGISSKNVNPTLKQVETKSKTASSFIDTKTKIDSHSQQTDIKRQDTKHADGKTHRQESNQVLETDACHQYKRSSDEATLDGIRHDISCITRFLRQVQRTRNEDMNFIILVLCILVILVLDSRLQTWVVKSEG